MRQTTIDPRPPHRTGLLRRILTGGGGSPAVRQHLHSDVLDLRSPRTYPGSFEDLSARVERLEMGMELMASTMKRALTRLADRTVSTSEEVERMVGLALGPLSGAVAELSEQVRSLPLDLASAAAAAKARDTGVTDVDPDLPATPFELEPIEEGMDALTALRRARFAEDDGP
jgi:outer membrane murein-binding lipoprotein Lpp